MGFFKNLNKKIEEENEEFLEINGLKIENYDSEQLGKRNIENLKKIQKDHSVTGLKDIAMISTNLEGQVKLGYLRALVEQGWIQIRQNEIQIRQNEIMIKKLQELGDK